MNIQKFNYDVDLLAVVLWQYNEATNLLSLLEQKQAWYDNNQTVFWEGWYNQVFNLSPWNSQITPFGLAVWSIILNMPLYIPLGDVVSTVEWGFNQIPPVNDYLNFDNAPFPPTTPVITLTAPQQHFLLLLKYFNCTTRGTVNNAPGTSFVQSTENAPYYNNYLYNINSFLQALCFYLGDAIGYSGQTIVCNDNLDMTITYVFSDPSQFPSNLARAIAMLDLYPRPAGVAIV
jgi:hypothetical protein